MNYELKGREVLTEKGRLAATLDDDGNPVMAPGMQGPHTAGVREFLAQLGGNAAANAASPATPATPASPAAVPEFAPDEDEDEEFEEVNTGRLNADEAEEKETVMYFGRTPASSPDGTPVSPEKEKTLEEWTVDTIPDDRLPPFSRELGVNTPGFAEYVKRHKFTAPQVAALVKRLEKIER